MSMLLILRMLDSWLLILEAVEAQTMRLQLLLRPRLQWLLLQ